jgi:hypothetical protein
MLDFANFFFKNRMRFLITNTEKDQKKPNDITFLLLFAFKRTSKDRVSVRGHLISTGFGFRKL